VATSTRATSAAIVELYSDVQRCAESAGLVYIEGEPPGITRLRRGKGFSYRTADGTLITDAALKQGIAGLAIPPAWRKVWICPSPDGHLLATGEDDRGRKQYLYHPKWREIRDLLNAYRLIVVGERLPKIREHVERQLRRRTLDRDRVLASMIRIIDSSGMRIGNEIYAEENDSFGLTTLNRRHVTVRGTTTQFDFPAKSGQRSHIEVRDAQVATVVGKLLDQRQRRLFTIGGKAIDSNEVNDVLSSLSEEAVTAKDFRTWRGTLTAFAYLRSHQDADPESTALSAVDAAAEELHNTRAVARDHYVHPHLLSTFIDGSFARRLAAVRARRLARLDPDGRLLLAFLEDLLGDAGLT
jgi:DNA topoisomerase-1